MPVHTTRTLRYLRWLFAFTGGAAVLLPLLVLFSVRDAPQHGWNTSAGDVLWLTALFAPGPAALPTGGMIMAIPGMLLASQAVGALAGAVITAVAQWLRAGRG